MFLVPAYAVVVAAPSGPDQGCPSPHQITDALMARIPAVVVSGSEASNPGVLKLAVSGGSGSDPLRIEMTDQGGEARLYRNLTISERGRGDCTALAETVALIVDRFLHDLGYEAPTTLPAPLPAADANLSRGPPPVPVGAVRFDLFAGGPGAPVRPTNSDFELGFGLGLERGVAGRRFAATFTGGTSGDRHYDRSGPIDGDAAPHAVPYWVVGTNRCRAWPAGAGRAGGRGLGIFEAGAPTHRRYRQNRHFHQLPRRVGAVLPRQHVAPLLRPDWRRRRYRNRL